MIGLRRRTVPLAIAAIVAVVGVGVAVWAVWLRDDEAEPVNVAVYEGDVLVASATRSDALDLVAERLSFEPVIPDGPLLDGLRLGQARSILPPEAGAEAPRSLLTFVDVDVGQPTQIVQIGQSTASPDQLLEDARTFDVAQDGVEAWALKAEGTPGGTYWLHAGGVYVYVAIGMERPVSDDEAADLLRSLARQLT